MWFVTAHARTPGPAGGGPPYWTFVTVGQLGPSVDLVDLLAPVLRHHPLLTSELLLGSPVCRKSQE